MTDPYQVLGVSRKASEQEVTEAYRRLAKKYHPDLHPNDPLAQKKMAELNVAYEAIKSGSAAYSHADTYGGPYQRADTAQRGTDYYGVQQLLRFGRYADALAMLNLSRERSARWYAFAALAHAGLNQKETALELISTALAMEPSNLEYLLIRQRIMQEAAEPLRPMGTQKPLGNAFEWLNMLWLLFFCRCCC